MIVGAGVDIEQISRVRAAIEKHGQRFLDRVFTAREVAYAEGGNHRFERYTGRFAAKEAGMKALGTGWSQGIRWVDLEVVSGPNGRPSLVLHGRAAAIAGQLGCAAAHVSLSHTRDLAVAQVILEK